jgi:hypothetical protein
MFPPFPFLFSVLLSTSPQIQNKDVSFQSSNLDELLRSFDLEVASFPGTGRGLKTTRDRRAEDVLLAVPEEMIITSASILAQHPFLNDVLNHKSLSDQQVLTLGLCLKRQHEADDYGYISSLPDQYSVFNMPHYLLIGLPRTNQRLVELTREYAMEAYHSLCEALLLQPDEERLSSTNNVEIPSLENFLWALSMVR